MAELIHQYTQPIQGPDSKTYDALVFGEARADGTWEGWIEFRPLDTAGAELRTARETSQPDRKALVYWASGLETTYYEGALARAIR